MRTDRLAIVTEQVATQIEALDPTPHLDPTLGTVVKLAKSVPRIDLPALVTSTAASWLRSLPSSAAADPERAERVALWLAEMLAWLRGQTDVPPGDLTL